MVIYVCERERERERSSLHPFPLRETAAYINLDRSLGSREEKKKDRA